MREPPNPNPLKRALARLLLRGRLPGWPAAFLHAWVRADPDWAAYYHALRACERAASGNPGVTSEQRDLIESLVLRPTSTHTAWAPRVAFALVPVAAAVLLVVIAQKPETVWSARSVDAAVPHVGLRARCLDQSKQRVLADTAVGPARPQGELVCPGATFLAFSLTNLEDVVQHVFVVGVSRDGGLRWYAPFEETSSSWFVPAGERDQMVDVLADVSTMPADERVSLFVLFSDNRITGADIRQQLSRPLLERVPLASQERLPVDARWQARIDLRRGTDR